MSALSSFKTQLGNTDILVRTVTDIFWMSSTRVRSWGGNVRLVYYGVLAVFSFWALLALHSASPMQLFTILANMAGLILVIGGIQVLIVNRRFLPRRLQPALWKQGMLLLCSAFYAFFSFFVLRELARGWLG